MAEGVSICYQHDDGRYCIVGPDGQWRHWTHEQPEPGPRDVREYLCDRVHPSVADRRVNIDGPEPTPVFTSKDEDRDLGFGMPTIGGALRGSLPRGNPWDAKPSAGTHDSPGAFDIAPGHIHFKSGPAVWIDKDGVHRRYAQNGNDTEPVTDDARYILEQLPRIIEDFLESNAKYARAQAGHDLGLKGIIPDINRKTSALITRIWDGQDYGRDETEEVVGDLIGHLLLMLAKMRSDD